MRGLDGKVAIVAGGGSGIGAATSARLAEEGATVVVGDLDARNADDVAARIVDAGHIAVAVAFDIASEAAVDELVSTAVDTFGGFDAVHVNAADLSPGTLGRDSDAETVPLDVFDRTVAVNLRGHLLVTRRVIPELVARGGGSIVYTASNAAFTPQASRPSYAITKGGLLALSRHVAARWGKQAIRANVVTPGLVLTDTAVAHMDATLRERAEEGCRLPRLGRPDDIAAAVAFLLSDDAQWITGQILSVDGGSSMR